MIGWITDVQSTSRRKLVWRRHTTFVLPTRSAKQLIPRRALLTIRWCLQAMAGKPTIFGPRQQDYALRLKRQPWASWRNHFPTNQLLRFALDLGLDQTLWSPPDIASLPRKTATRPRFSSD